MTGSTTHQDMGCSEAGSPDERDALIREKVRTCGSDMLGKIDACLEKAKRDGKEKLLSEAVTLRSKIQKIMSENSLEETGVRFKIEVLGDGERIDIREIDDRLLSALDECSGLLRAFICSDTALDVVRQYTVLNTHLEEVRRLFQERKKIFKKLRVYG